MRVAAADLPDLLPDLEAVRPRALVLVELTAATPPVEVVRAAARSQDVLVGVAVDGLPDSPLLDHLTTTVVRAGHDRRTVRVDDLDAAVDRVAASTRACPQTACVLAGLLRLSERLPVRDALLAESLAYSTLQSGDEHLSWLQDRVRRDPVEVDHPVLLEREGDLLRLRLNRPQRRNAIDRHTREGLLEGLAVAQADPDLLVELSGVGPSFSAGGDLDEFGTLADPASGHLLRTTRSAALVVDSLRDRVTARVHGPCAGAGVELPAFAGRVVAAPGTTFLLPELRLGLVPGAGGTVSLPRRIGRWRTAWLVLDGTPLDAVTARAWGLVDEIA
ncbi:MAG: hypothetical protein JWL64_2675 [Frankiales bacterium]|nr:hypothetical protein [Frankiales bacterium]